jgi:hypothetical protein
MYLHLGDVLGPNFYRSWRGGEVRRKCLDRRNTLVVSEFEPTVEPLRWERLRVLVVYDCDLMIRLLLASLIDLTTAISSLKSTISKPLTHT